MNYAEIMAKRRKQFEIWLREAWRGDINTNYNDLRSEYEDVEIDYYWRAWQAGRDSAGT